MEEEVGGLHEEEEESLLPREEEKGFGRQDVLACKKDPSSEVDEEQKEEDAV